MSTEFGLDDGSQIALARLEFEVCEAAIERRRIESMGLACAVTKPFDLELGRQYFEAHLVFVNAVDALIAARKKLETQVLYNKTPAGISFTVKP